MVKPVINLLVVPGEHSMKKIGVGILSVAMLLFGGGSISFFSAIISDNCMYVCDIEYIVGFLFLYLALLSALIAFRIHKGSFGLVGRLSLSLPLLILGSISILNIIANGNGNAGFSAICLLAAWFMWAISKPAVKGQDE
jgi:hypothetical protein